MSGDRFPFIMGIVGLIDALIGLAVWLIGALFWLVLILGIGAAIVSIFD